MASVPVISLSTVPDRKVVAIDGVGYYLRTLEDLSLAQLHTVQRLSPTISALLAMDALTAEQEVGLMRSLAEICAIALEAPPDVLEKLQPVNRMMVFRLFSDLLLPRLTAAGAVIEAMAMLTVDPAVASNGTTSSPSSPASTAGRSANGGKTRRSDTSRRR